MTDPNNEALKTKLSRPLDPNWTTRHEGIRHCLTQVYGELEVIESRQRKRGAKSQDNYIKCIDSIVLDLFRARLAWPEYLVGIGTGQTVLQAKSKSRYVPDFITARAFRDAIELLVAGGYIQTTGQFVSPGGDRQSQTKRYWLSDATRARLQATGGQSIHLERNPEAEGIILKDRKKKYIEYGHIPFAEDARVKLDRINLQLQRHWCDIALSDQELERLGLVMEKKEVATRPNDRDYRAIDLSARTLHRVFNNGSWEQGGRFYGGWWQNLPKKLRRHIIIEDETTVEVDFSGIHPAMMFARAGLDVPDDPYARCMVGNGSDKVRDCIKLTFNALLNAGSIASLQPQDWHSEKLTGMSWDAFKDHIVGSFPEFGDQFGSGLGLELQYYDSIMAEAILLHFANMGTTCLPVHDSFIVHIGLEDELRDLMGEIFEKQFGKTINMKTKSIMDEYVPSDQKTDTEQLIGSWLDAGYANRRTEWLHFRANLSESSLAKGVSPSGGLPITGNDKD